MALQTEPARSCERFGACRNAMCFFGVFLWESAPVRRWWRGLDSNQRRRESADLQSAAFNHSATPPTQRSCRGWRGRVNGRFGLSCQRLRRQIMRMRQQKPHSAGRKGQTGRQTPADRGQNRPGNRSRLVRIYGRHPVTAALANPQRKLARLYATREALAALPHPPKVETLLLDSQELRRLVPEGAPHQGLVLEAHPLDGPDLFDILQNIDPADKRPILVLDQVTDPHNIGAILRSAAAFDARAVVTQDRHAPPETGALAKSASGALELVPWVRVVNLARALDEIAEAGFWRIGMDGRAERTLNA